MQEENKNDVPMVDIDNSGEDTEVILENPKSEVEVETKEEESSPAPQAEENVEASDEKPEATQEEKPEEKKEELETYSKDVQRRISKLTKKWREAERQKDEALSFAQNQKEQKEKLQKKYSSVEQAGVKDREEKQHMKIWLKLNQHREKYLEYLLNKLRKQTLKQKIGVLEIDGLVQIQL